MNKMKQENPTSGFSQPTMNRNFVQESGIFWITNWPTAPLQGPKYWEDDSDEFDGIDELRKPNVWILPTRNASWFEPKNNIIAPRIGNFLNKMLIHRTAAGAQILGRWIRWMRWLRWIRKIQRLDFSNPKCVKIWPQKHHQCVKISPRKQHQSCRNLEFSEPNADPPQRCGDPNIGRMN